MHIRKSVSFFVFLSGLALVIWVSTSLWPVCALAALWLSFEWMIDSQSLVARYPVLFPYASLSMRTSLAAQIVPQRPAAAAYLADMRIEKRKELFEGWAQSVVVDATFEHIFQHAGNALLSDTDWLVAVVDKVLSHFVQLLSRTQRGDSVPYVSAGDRISLILQTVPDAVKNDVEFWHKIVDKTLQAVSFEHLRWSLMYHIVVNVSEHLKGCSDDGEIASESSRARVRELWQKVCQHNGHILRHLGPNWRGNFPVVYTAVKQDPRAYLWASPALRGTTVCPDKLKAFKTLCLQTVASGKREDVMFVLDSGFGADSMGCVLKKEKDFMLELVKVNPHVLRCISNDWELIEKHWESVVYVAQHKPTSFIDVFFWRNNSLRRDSRGLRDDRVPLDIILELVSFDGGYLPYFNMINKLKNTEEVSALKALVLRALTVGHFHRPLVYSPKLHFTTVLCDFLRTMETEDSDFCAKYRDMLLADVALFPIVYRVTTAKALEYQTPNQPYRQITRYVVKAVGATPNKPNASNMFKSKIEFGVSNDPVPDQPFFRAIFDTIVCALGHFQHIGIDSALAELPFTEKMKKKLTEPKPLSTAIDFFRVLLQKKRAYLEVREQQGQPLGDRVVETLQSLQSIVRILESARHFLQTVIRREGKDIISGHERCYSAGKAIADRVGEFLTWRDIIALDGACTLTLKGEAAEAAKRKIIKKLRQWLAEQRLKCKGALLDPKKRLPIVILYPNRVANRVACVSDGLKKVPCVAFPRAVGGCGLGGGGQAVEKTHHQLMRQQASLPA